MEWQRHGQEAKLLAEQIRALRTDDDRVLLMPCITLEFCHQASLSRKLSLLEQERCSRNSTETPGPSTVTVPLLATAQNEGSEARKETGPHTKKIPDLLLLTPISQNEGKAAGWPRLTLSSERNWKKAQGIRASFVPTRHFCLSPSPTQMPAWLQRSCWP